VSDFKGHSDWVQSVAFSPNGQLLASGSEDHTIKLWDSRTGELCQTLKGHSNAVRSVTFSPNGRLLASGSGDDTIKLWDSSTGELRQTIEGHPSLVQSVAFSPNSQLLTSGSMDHTINLWDSGTCELRQTLKGHSHWVWAGAHMDGLSVLEDQWIFFQGRSILWLPPNWRPSCMTFKEGILALGHASGRVSFISISS
jgi:WD40 repeat protein